MTILMFISALTLSVIAAFYSLMGLAAIFAAAVVPILVMGSVLEVSKLVVASWLYRNWKPAPFLLKTYLTFAVIILMVITSMGIFGFLSKAHLDQAIPTGDIAEKIVFIDEQINIERETIKNNKSLIKQMDDVVNRKMESEGRTLKDKQNNTYVEDVAERALKIRRSQGRDRAKFTAEIKKSQDKIIELQQSKAPISKNLRELEAEVGPIKYIAALIYGNNPDKNLLEKAVRGMIIMIVIVFDPLAVLMLIAANWSWKQSHPSPPRAPINAPIRKEPIVKKQQPESLIIPEKKDLGSIKSNAKIRVPQKTKRKWLDPDPKSEPVVDPIEPKNDPVDPKSEPVVDPIEPKNDPVGKNLGRYETDLEIERIKRESKVHNLK